MMNKNVKKITCPSCKSDISLDEAFTHQIEEAAKQALLTEQVEKEAEFKTREEEILKREQLLLSSKKEIDQQILKAQEKIKSEVEKDVKERIEKEKESEIKALSDEITEKSKSLEEARKAELEIRKERLRFEDEKNAFLLTKQREMDAEREKIRLDAQKKAEDGMHLKMLEKDKQFEDARKANLELNRKLQQGSQQTQGEVLELELEGLLKSAFIFDSIEPVPKGVNGADIIQKVFGSSGKNAGSIIWEAKHTKSWSEGWIQKLKEDQRKVNSEIAVLITDVLPKDIKNFGEREGIWITDYPSVIGLAAALRHGLIQVSAVKLSTIGKNEKLESLYTYLSGVEFRHKIEAIIAGFSGLKQDLDKEKLTMTRMWAKREKQIQQVVNNTVGMYGDFEGMLGSDIQTIPALEGGIENDNAIEDDL